MNAKKAENLFIGVAKQYGECEDILEDIRSLRSTGELTEKEYDYIITKWDDLLKKNNL